MRYRLTAELQGQTVSAQSYEWEAPEHTVGLVLSEKGRVSHIWIEARVVDFEPYLPRLTPHTDGPSVIGIPAVRVREHLLDVLQYLESLGSFWFGIERLNWGSAKEEWLPDSAEEKARLSISAFSHKLEYPATPVPVKPDVIAGLLGKREVLSYLTIPMSFYREGTNEYRDHKYVAAFRNFYFVIEDLYGQAKTKNRAVLQAFKGSSQLRDAYRQVYEQLEHSDFAQHKAALLPLMATLGCEYSVAGLIEFTVMMRGELHHFSQHSTRPKGHPFNQSQFQSVAFLGLSVCLQLFQQLANGTPLEIG